MRSMKSSPISPWYWFRKRVWLSRGRRYIPTRRRSVRSFSRSRSLASCCMARIDVKVWMFSPRLNVALAVITNCFSPGTAVRVYFLAPGATLGLFMCSPSLKIGVLPTSKICSGVEISDIPRPRANFAFVYTQNVFFASKLSKQKGS